MTHKQAAQDMLEALYAFAGGCEVTPQQMELRKSVVTASVFAAAAYDAYEPKVGGECNALALAFLLALIDPTHPDLDYLRADPAAGEVAREANRKLEQLAGGTPC